MKLYIAVPAIGALVYRAWSKKSLTPAGIFVAFLTAVAHAYHPWNLPFVLLATFFLAGTRATHVRGSATFMHLEALPQCADTRATVEGEYQSYVDHGRQGRAVGRRGPPNSCAR